MPRHSPILAAVDLGTHKIAVLLCEIASSGLQVVGFGQAASRGVRRGVIVNIESAADAFREALDQAQKVAGREVEFLFASVSGAHIQALSSHGMIPVREKEIKESDITRVIEAASAVHLPLDREVIQLIPREFIVDGEGGIKDPRGMYGRRLEVNIQLITGAITTLQNIRRSLSKHGPQNLRFISSPLASARAVLSAEEKEAGVCVVDIGAASTDLAIFEAGVLSAIRSIGLGGMHLTNDLAVGLKTNLSDAEKIKCQYGLSYSASPHSSALDEIEIPGLSGQEPRLIERRMLTTILQPRMEELLELIRNELAKEGVDESLPSGLVFTGGASLTKGLVDLSQRLLPLPVRVGRPHKLGGLSEMISSPAYSALVGLIQLGFEESEDLKYYSTIHQQSGVKKIRSQMSRFFKDFF
jgi:cell division protein FtsA